jgi:hypothetical protein
MDGEGESQRFDLAAQVRALNGFAISEPEAVEAVRSLAGFIELLAQIDAAPEYQGIDHASDGSGRGVRKAPQRASRVRQRRAR